MINCYSLNFNNDLFSSCKIGIGYVLAGFQINVCYYRADFVFTENYVAETFLWYSTNLHCSFHHQKR